jgi:hypothetical protein
MSHFRGEAAFVSSRRRLRRLRLGSSQPKPRAWRRKHIADGPEGAASRLPARRAIQLGEARARQRLTLQGVARCRAGRAHFSTTNCSNFHEYGAASPEILPRLGWLAEPSEFCGEAALVSGKRRLRRLRLGSARRASPTFGERARGALKTSLP